MKLNSINPTTVKILTIAGLSACTLFLSSCSDDDPVKEDVPELITKATLTFTPSDGGAAVVVSATDPDGDGVQNIAPDGEIVLAKGKTYTLALELINGLAVPTDPAYNVTEEVEEEGDEHMFFFGWTNNAFTDPAGNGNIDRRADAVNYDGAANSKDANGLPLGLTTRWVTAAGDTNGTFRIILKHQPDLKSETSDSNAGETDLDVTFTLNVQ